MPSDFPKKKQHIEDADGNVANRAQSAGADPMLAILKLAEAKADKPEQQTENGKQQLQAADRQHSQSDNFELEAGNV